MTEAAPEFDAEIHVRGVSDELFDSSFFIDVMHQVCRGSRFKIDNGPGGVVVIYVEAGEHKSPRAIERYLRELLADKEPSAVVELMHVGAANIKQPTPASQPPRATAPADLPPTDREKLLAYDRVCRVLWPAVRHFGLLGAHPEYVEAVVELAGLLGIGSPVARNLQVIEAAARADGVAAVSEWIKDSKELKEMIGGRMCERIAELVSRVRVDG